jgi:hypothetical protein
VSENQVFTKINFWKNNRFLNLPPSLDGGFENIFFKKALFADFLHLKMEASDFSNS